MHCAQRGQSLYLVVTKAGSKIWTLRYKKPGDGRVTETSVGKYPLLGLAEARKKATNLASDVAMNKDPIEQKRAKREKPREQKQTFRTALDAYANAPAYRAKAATAMLIERLERHAAGLMRQNLDAIDSARVAKALAKVHESAPHTGRRTLVGVARVFDYARVMGLIDARRPNPATFRGGFEHLWGPPEPTRHWRAVDYERVPDLYAQLRDLDDMSVAWCLRFRI